MTDLEDARYCEIFEYDENNYGMLFTDVSVDPYQISLATSSKADPHSWTRDVDNPIISVDGGSRGQAVIKETDGTYRVLIDLLPSFAYAYGADLKNLTLYNSGTPVFAGQGTDWEAYIRHPALIKVGNVYHMFYDGRVESPTGEHGSIGHATSTDMINWTRDENNPIISPVDGSDWEPYDCGSPCVALIDGVYYVYYAGYNGSSPKYRHDIGYASSTDLITWTKYNNNPVILPIPGNFDEYAVTAPFVIEIDGTTYIYYSGSNIDGSKICYAYK